MVKTMKVAAQSDYSSASICRGLELRKSGCSHQRHGCEGEGGDFCTESRDDHYDGLNEDCS